jgi:hypothetical protein
MSPANPVSVPRGRVNHYPDPARRDERKTLCGLVWDRQVYGPRARGRAACRECAAALALSEGVTA